MRSQRALAPSPRDRVDLVLRGAAEDLGEQLGLRGEVAVDGAGRHARARRPRRRTRRRSRRGRSARAPRRRSARASRRAWPRCARSAGTACARSEPRFSPLRNAAVHLTGHESIGRTPWTCGARACGEENPERARFCLACGTPLARRPPASPREVRKTVTVLFADLVGFTSLGERLDQESLRRVMDRFYEEMRGAIERARRHGREVHRRRGDGRLGHAGRCARTTRCARCARPRRCARALAALNDDLERRWGVRVGMRTGVNTGEVVVDPTQAGRPARRRHDERRGAARAGGGRRRGARRRARRTGSCATTRTLEPVEPLAAQGQGAAPVPRLPARRRPRGPSAARDARLQAPLVGRDARARAPARGVRRARRPRAQTGSSTRHRLARRRQDAPGRASSPRGSADEARRPARATASPRARASRSCRSPRCCAAAAGIGEGDAAARRRAQARRRSLPDEPRPRARSSSAPLGAARARRPAVGAEETFWAVRRVLEALARERPLVVVLDDVHWGAADVPRPRRAPRRVGPRRAGARSSRSPGPELREVRPDARPSRARCVDRRHRRSSRSRRRQPRARRPACSARADLPAGAGRARARDDRGQPAVPRRDAADARRRRRAARARATRWVVARRPSGVDVPPTIHALLAARIERLARRRAQRRRARRGDRPAVLPRRGRRAAPGRRSPPTSTSTSTRCAARSWSRPRARAGSTSRSSASTTCSSATPRTARCSRRRAPSCTSASPTGSRQGAATSTRRSSRFHLERAYALPRASSGRSTTRRATLGRARRARGCTSAGRRALAREDLPGGGQPARAARSTPLDGRRRRPRAEVLRRPRRGAALGGRHRARPSEVVEELALRAEARRRRALRALGDRLRRPARDPHRRAAQSRETIDAARDGGGDARRAPATRAGEAKAHHVAARRARAARRRSPPPRPRSTARSSPRAPRATAAA